MNSWELFPKLTELVHKDHEGKDCGHHPFEHAVMVAQYCQLVETDNQARRLATIAALLHNTDRLYPESDAAGIEYHLRTLIQESLGTVLYEPEIRIIVDAVLNHSKKNDPSDSPVLVCLKDADRLANINPFDIIARAARAYPTLPLVDPRFIASTDPASTYRDPKTVLRDAIHSTLEWETWLRLPKARELAKPYFDGLRLVQSLTLRQHWETRLDSFGH